MLTVSTQTSVPTLLQAASAVSRVVQSTVVALLSSALEGCRIPECCSGCRGQRVAGEIYLCCCFIVQIAFGANHIRRRV